MTLNNQWPEVEGVSVFVRRRLFVIVPVLLCCFVFGVGAVDRWEEIVLEPGESVWASSELEETVGGVRVRYTAENVFDGKRSTCWVEAAEGSGEGESLTFVVNRPVARIGMRNGFAKNGTLFRINNRVRGVGVSLIAAFTAPGLVTELDYSLYFGAVWKARRPIYVEDTPLLQYFDFPFSGQEQDRFLRTSLESFIEDHPPFAGSMAKELGYGGVPGKDEDAYESFLSDTLAAYSLLCVRLEIEQVYRGSRYDDTCIAELDVEFE